MSQQLKEGIMIAYCINHFIGMCSLQKLCEYLNEAGEFLNWNCENALAPIPEKCTKKFAPQYEEVRVGRFAGAWMSSRWIRHDGEVLWGFGKIISVLDPRLRQYYMELVPITPPNHFKCHTNGTLVAKLFNTTFRYDKHCHYWPAALELLSPDRWEECSKVKAAGLLNELIEGKDLNRMSPTETAKELQTVLDSLYPLPPKQSDRKTQVLFEKLTAERKERKKWKH